MTAATKWEAGLRPFLAIIRENLDRAEVDPRNAVAHLLGARAAVADALRAAGNEASTAGRAA